MGEKEIDLDPYRDSELKETYYLACKVIRMPFMIITVLWLIIFFFDNIIAFYVGAPIALFGEILQINAASYILKMRHFTVSGPYAHVRNPMYIGRLFIGLGIVIMSLNPYIIGGYIISFAIYAATRVRREERILHGLFGNKYKHYIKEVPKWIPRKKKYSRSEARTSSWLWVKKNREDLNLYGLIAVLVFIYFKITIHPQAAQKITELVTQLIR